MLQLIMNPVVKFYKIVLDHAPYLVQARFTHAEIMQTLKIGRCAVLRLLKV